MICGASALHGDIAVMADAICDDIINRGEKMLSCLLTCPALQHVFQDTNAIRFRIRFYSRYDNQPDTLF